MGEITSWFITSMNPTSVTAYIGMAARQMKDRNMNGMMIGEPSSWIIPLSFRFSSASSSPDRSERRPQIG